MIKCAVCVHADVCNGSFNKDATCMYFKPIRLEGHCNFCEETEINKIKKIEICYTRTNPTSKSLNGYSWVNSVKINRCPVCGRVIR